MLRTRLKNWLSWQPQPAEFLGLMRPVKPWPVQMERFSKGVDNAHVDVFLSRRFVLRARTVVRKMVHHDVGVNYWSDSEGKPTHEELEEFRTAYRGLVEGAMRRREQLAPADWVRLIQLSLLKHLLLLVPAEIQELRRRLEVQRDEEQAVLSGQRLELHERLVVLSREENAIAFRVYRLLFRVVEKLETIHLRKLRKSLLGASWPLPMEALFNPLLQMPNLLAEEEVMHHYPVMCIEEHGRDYLDAINRCVVHLFREYLPTWVQRTSRAARDGLSDGERGRLRIMDRLDQGVLRGFLETEITLSQLLSEDEYKKSLNSWLDDPENMELLLGAGHSLGVGRGESAGGRSNGQWREFRRSVRQHLFHCIERLNIIPQIVASYWTPRLYQELSGKVPARLVYHYLTGEQDKRRILRRMATTHPEADPSLAAKTLEFAAGEIKQLSRGNRHEYVRRLLIDFLVLRRDLKLAYKTFQAMDGIRLLEEDEDINLSRANGLLYEFSLTDEHPSERRIRCHVILKADVRGSTTITKELRARKLNPATHFSRNFFGPINEFLADFGAEKVFVEGDAVILSFLEYTGGSGRALSVAHSCGLATRILEVVNRQNGLNRKHGLPDLELGLGISFCDEEPTFLYDEDRKIMISPAINLADRLSSCAKLLRDAPFVKAGRPFRVEVLVPGAGVELPAHNKTDVLRYNVNGIEMDSAAFVKLKTELVLTRMDIQVAGQPERFHVGRYPDRGGRMHWLIVRESPVRVWDGHWMTKEVARDRRFYEVIVDPGLVTLIRSRLRAVREGKSVSGLARRLSS